MRLLIVDDSKLSRMMLKAIVVDTCPDSEIIEASNGDEALAQIADLPEVDMAIVDYNMPGMDGLQLLHALRSHAGTRGVGFLLITGRADREIIDMGKKLGMNNFLKKPFEPAGLRSAIEAIVGKL